MERNHSEPALGTIEKADGHPGPSGKVLYTAKTHTTGGRENGVARSSDDRLNIRLAAPNGTQSGTNPEQLFAAGWSACFEGAMGIVARRMRIVLPKKWLLTQKLTFALATAEPIFLRQG